MKIIIKVTVLLIIIGTLGTVTKGLVPVLEDLEIAGQVETIQTTALLRSARFGGAHGVMVIVIGNGHGDTSSNPGRD